jgi:hypothetical protein
VDFRNEKDFENDAADEEEGEETAAPELARGGL